MTDIERFDKIAQNITNLHVKRYSNYGNSFEKLYNDLGPIAGLVPLHNKLDKLTNLIKEGHTNNESMETTLIDLATYAIMNIIELQKIQEIKENKNTCDICGTPIPKGRQVCMSCEIKTNKQ